MNTKKIKILLVFFFLCAWTFGFAKSYAVIVHPDNPAAEFTAKDLKKIFLGEKTAWPDGQTIKLVLLKDGEAHKEFLKDIVKSNPMKFATYWKQKIFTGGATGTDIIFFNSDGKVKEYIKANPTAVGYIEVSSLDAAVKEIKIAE